MANLQQDIMDENHDLAGEFDFVVVSRDCTPGPADSLLEEILAAAAAITRDDESSEGLIGDLNFDVLEVSWVVEVKEAQDVAVD